MSGQSKTRPRPGSAGRFKRIGVLVCVNVVVTGVLFGLMNVAAAAYLLRLSHQRRESFMEQPKNVAAVARAYAAAGLEGRMAALRAVPPPRLHPRLATVSGVSSEEYTVGLAGARYEPGWDDERVRRMLVGRPSFLMGGSTVFGVGVPGDETISAHLNRSGAEPAFVNLGAVAYDSNAELDLLVYLLRRGYRPRRLVLLDGLNDFGYGRDLSVADHLDVGGLDARSVGSLRDSGISGAPSRAGLMRAFLYSLPLYHLIARQAGRLDDRVEPVDPMTQPWDVARAAYPPATLTDADHLWIAKRWLRYYRRHMDFVQQLGQGFGFEAHAVLQPVGPSDPSSHFEVPAGLARYSSRVLAHVRKAIAAGELPMQDCSTTFEVDRAAHPKQPDRLYYVDATHYTPLGNRLLAACIARGLAPSIPSATTASSPPENR